MQILGSAFGRQMAAASLASAATAAASTATSSGGAALSWDVMNWPFSHEYFSILHFDLAELKQKRPANMYAYVRGCYTLVQMAALICLINFVTAIVMAASDAGRGVYSSANVFFSLVWALIMPGVAMGFTYKIYHGMAAPNTMSLMVGKVRVILWDLA